MSTTYSTWNVVRRRAWNENGATSQGSQGSQWSHLWSVVPNLFSQLKDDIRHATAVGRKTLSQLQDVIQYKLLHLFGLRASVQVTYSNIWLDLPEEDPFRSLLTRMPHEPELDRREIHEFLTQTRHQIHQWNGSPNKSEPSVEPAVEPLLDPSVEPSAHADEKQQGQELNSDSDINFNSDSDDSSDDDEKESNAKSRAKSRRIGLPILSLRRLIERRVATWPEALSPLEENALFNLSQSGMKCHSQADLDWLSEINQINRINIHAATTNDSIKHFYYLCVLPDQVTSTSSPRHDDEADSASLAILLTLWQDLKTQKAQSSPYQSIIPLLAMELYYRQIKIQHEEPSKETVSYLAYLLHNSPVQQQVQGVGSKWPFKHAQYDPCRAFVYFKLAEWHMDRLRFDRRNEFYGTAVYRSIARSCTLRALRLGSVDALDLLLELWDLEIWRPDDPKIYELVIRLIDEVQAYEFAQHERVPRDVTLQHLARYQWRQVMRSNQFYYPNLRLKYSGIVSMAGEAKGHIMPSHFKLLHGPFVEYIIRAMACLSGESRRWFFDLMVETGIYDKDDAYESDDDDDDPETAPKRLARENKIIQRLHERLGMDMDPKGMGPMGLQGIGLGSSPKSIVGAYIYLAVLRLDEEQVEDAGSAFEALEMAMLFEQKEMPWSPNQTSIQSVDNPIQASYFAPEYLFVLRKMSRKRMAPLMLESLQMKARLVSRIDHLQAMRKLTDDGIALKTVLDYL